MIIAKTREESKMFDDREMSENQYLDEVYGDNEDDFDEGDDYEPEDEDIEWDDDDDLEEILN